MEPIAPPLPVDPPQAPSRNPAAPASANSGPIRPSCRRVVHRPDITLLVPRFLPCHIRFAYDSITPVSVNPSFRLTASIGAFRVPAWLPLNEALRYADEATYRAKAAGRDCVRMHPGLDRAA